METKPTFRIITRRLQETTANSFLLWEEDDLFPALGYPVKINFTGIFICSAGTLDVEINLTPMRMDENHILVFTHEHAVRIVKRSEDFKCVGIILSKAYWEETLLHTHAFNALTRTVPCLPIEPDQKKPLLDFFSIIRTHTKLKDAENRNEIIKHLVISMFYAVGEVYKQQLAQKRTTSQHEKLLHDFLELIYQHYKTHRDVAFYAQCLSLTPRYLTTTIKKTSGKNALQWIEEYVILEIQILLRHSDMTIKQIAYEMNFCDQSFLGKYIKRITGMSPEQYRNL